MSEKAHTSEAKTGENQLGDLLDILVCPKTKGELEVVALPDSVCQNLVEKYREHFHDEDPVVSQGLLCRESDLIYPIVSEIPIMLIDDALPATALENAQ